MPVVFILMHGASLTVGFLIGYTHTGHRSVGCNAHIIPLEPGSHQISEPNPIKAGTKVVALDCNLIEHSHADLKTPIEQGNTCVVRQAQVAPDDAVMIQLIGVTVVRFGKAWEPCWDARGLKALEEMRGRDVQLL
jgi:hypothetical protein